MKTKLSLILASLAMAFSVGAGVASTKINKSVQPVEAAQHADNYSSYTYSGSYYSSAFSTYTEGLNGTLRTNLTTLIHPTSVPQYSSGLATHLQQADADPTNSSNMVYLYTRDSVKKNAASSWNREHVWPKALSNSCWKESRAGADMLHLRPTYSTPNSTRSSYKYGEVTKNSTNLQTYNSMDYGYFANNYFMPLDATKGDVARICMYIWVAYYNEYGSELPSLTNVFQSFDVLMTWHTNDRPDVLEGNRNDYAEKNVQYNRNPFVDHPEYAWKIFGSQCSQSVLNAAKAAYPDGDPVGITSISKSSATMAVGETTTISAVSSNSGTISWTTSNSSIASVSSSSTASGANVTITGVAAGTATITAKVTINGTEYPKTCTVTVTKVVSSLSKGSTSPTKTTYTAGESFDSTGLTITATYSDSTTSNVTSSVVWTPDPLTAGTTSVTGTFSGKTITITGLTVNAATEPEIIDSISDLSVGDYVVLRTAAGVGVTGWNNNKDATVSETESEWKKYYVASVNTSGFTLKDESANNYIASPGGSNQFIYGSAGTCSTDSDGHLICNERYLCKNGTNYRFYTSVGSYLPFFIYKVPASSTKTLSSISVATVPTKVTYTAGEYFDPTGLAITRTYSDSTSDTYAYAGHTSEFIFSPSTSTALTTSNTSVTITYSGKSTSQAITVNAATKTLSSISISGQTTSFSVDDTFSFGGTVTANFSDSSTSNVTSSATFSGYDMSVAGNYTVTVSYTYGGTTKTATYSITVNSSGGSGGGESGSFSGTYNYSNQGTGTGKTWSLTDCSDQNSYWLCPNTGDESIALISGIFTDLTITSNVVITINSGTYGSGTNPSSSTFAIYNSSACTSQVSATQTGTLPTSKTYTNAIYTVALANTGSFSDDLAIKITKPGKQIRLFSITVEFDYTESSTPVTPTSITASVSKTYYVGETISSSDITVKDNNNKTVSSFTFADDGYQFTYADAASGGASTSKTFTDAIAGANLTCSLTVQVQRKAYAAPTPGSTTYSTFTDLATSYTEGQSITISGMAFSVDGYRYNGKLSLSESQTSAPGKIVNSSPYSSGITNVTVSGASPDVQLSTDGSVWVDLSSATTSSVNYYYLKLFYKTTTQSNYVNITSFTVSYKGAESDANVANYVMYEDTNNQCNTKLDIAIGYLNNLTQTELNSFANKTESQDYVIYTARTRLNAWAASKGKTINYSTAGNVVMNSHVNPITNAFETGNATTIIIIIGIVGLTALGGYIFIRKRKEI